MKKTTMMLCLALVSGGAFAQHDHGNHDNNHATTAKKMGPMFKDSNLGTAYGIYIQLKNELVATNYDGAKTAADELVKALATVTNNEKTLSEATKVAAASSIADQRNAFSTLSNEMASLVKGQLSMGELYLEYCPMANGNKGASWLSNESEIKNPYFGSMMLKCGSVKETIN
jgi:hypothetical protein